MRYPNSAEAFIPQATSQVINPAEVPGGSGYRFSSQILRIRSVTSP
jgi:hypothetical protein